MRGLTSMVQRVSISYYCEGSNDEIYAFEARCGRKLEMAKMATKQLVGKLLNNGFRGSVLHFSGVDTETQRFFRHCAGLR